MRQPKPYRISFRVDADTLSWLESLGNGSMSPGEVARDVLVSSKVSGKTKGAYDKCLDYLGSVDNPEFIQGLQGLMSVLKEVH